MIVTAVVFQTIFLIKEICCLNNPHINSVYDEVYVDDDQGPVELKINAIIDNLNRRLLAYNNVWEANDSIGITTLLSNGSIDNLYINVPYFTPNNSLGSFVPNGTTMYFPQSGNDLHLFAYYPFDPNSYSNNWEIKKDTRFQNTHELQKQLDFLYAPMINASRTSESIDFLFSHKMTKIIITIRLTTGFTPDEISSDWSFYISGFQHNGTFNAFTGEAAVNNNDSLPIDDWNITDNYCDIDETEGTRTYTLLLFPQTLENGMRLSCVYKGKAYNATFASGSQYAAGMSYAYSISVKGPSTYTFTESNTFTKSNTYSQSNTYTKSETLVELNTFTLSNAFTISNTYSQSNKYPKSDKFTQSNTYTKSNTFIPPHVTFSCSKVLSYSFDITETIFANTFMSNTYLISFVNSSFVHIFTEFIFYQYSILRYTTYYSFYSNFFFIMSENNINDNEDDNKTNTIIIIVVCVLVGIIIICLLVIFLVRYRKHNQNESKDNESNSVNLDEIETQNNLSTGIKMTNVEEDPFAKDFNEDNNIDNI